MAQASLRSASRPGGALRGAQPTPRCCAVRRVPVRCQVGEFGGDNRAGIDRTLHRISCIRNRSGRIIGLTCRVGRAIKGSARLVSDLVTSGASILFLGRWGRHLVLRPTKFLRLRLLRPIPSVTGGLWVAAVARFAAPRSSSPGTGSFGGAWSTCGGGARACGLLWWLGVRRGGVRPAPTAARRPGVGKTTAIREVSRALADELQKRVVIVDTSNEIGGDGDIPHEGIGRARRIQVPQPEAQHRVMIEAVEVGGLRQRPCLLDFCGAEGAVAPLNQGRAHTQCSAACSAAGGPGAAGRSAC